MRRTSSKAATATLSWPHSPTASPYTENALRSLTSKTEDFSRPLIVVQGLEDEIVSPDQAEMIVQALQSKGVPVAYLPLENEQHGFRRAENISRMLDAELSFYAQLFALVLPAAEEIEPVAIEGFPIGHEKGGQSPA